MDARRLYACPKVHGTSSRNTDHPVKDAERVLANAEACDILKKPRNYPRQPILLCLPLTYASEEPDFVGRRAVARCDEGGGELVIGRRAVLRIASDPVIPPIHPAAAHRKSSVTFEAAKMGEGESIEMK